jgi:hypothetical protein
MFKKSREIFVGHIQQSQPKKSSEETKIDQREKHTNLSGCSSEIVESQTGDMFRMNDVEKSMDISLAE